MSTSERITVGQTTVTIDSGGLAAHITRVREAAAQTFLARARENLETLEAGAKTLWPVRPYKSQGSRNAFRIRTEADPDKLSVLLENTANQQGWGYYAYKIRFSVRVAEELQREAARIGDAIYHTDEEREQAKWQAVAFAARSRRRATSAELRQLWLARLFRIHGQGAPDRQIAGRNVWSELVRKPGAKLAQAMIEDLRSELTVLAGRA